MRNWLRAWGREAAQGCIALSWKNTSPYASAGPWRNSYQPWVTTRKTARQQPSPWRIGDNQSPAHVKGSLIPQIRQHANQEHLQSGAQLIHLPDSQLQS